MLKAGLRLTQLIGSINEDMCDILLKAGLMKKLIFLLSIPVKSFASSLRIRNGIIAPITGARILQIIPKSVIHAIDQLIHWPRGMSSFLRFNNTTEGVPGSGYEALVSLVLTKPTVRVVYAAGQILAKIDFTVNARQLQNMVFHMLEKSAFYEHKVDENISLPNYVAEGSRDSDTEDIDEKKYSNIERRISDTASENTQCEAEEIFGIESTAFDNKTIENLVKYLKKMTQVVQDPSKIAQIRMVSNQCESMYKWIKKLIPFKVQKNYQIEFVLNQNLFDKEPDSFPVFFRKLKL